MEVYGEAIVARFARKHPASPRPLQRFLMLARDATWPHFAAVKNTFAATGFVAGRLVFDIGGNKYRVVASVDFDAQILVLDQILTHQEYDRETI